MNQNSPKASRACDFIAAITQHIPDKRFQMVRYYGWYSDKMRGQRRKREEEAQEWRQTLSGTGNIDAHPHAAGYSANFVRPIYKPKDREKFRLACTDPRDLQRCSSGRESVQPIFFRPSSIALTSASMSASVMGVDSMPVHVPTNRKPSAKRCSSMVLSRRFSSALVYASR